ncbi:MAG: AAA family ATPase [Nitrososphaerota archaeon]|nr:AAA family ATPase [Nitrososphaerota archaeon]
MKLLYLGVRDFLSFGDRDVRLPLEGFNVIVGPNNSGKTNVLRALTFVGERLRNPGLDTSPFYHRADFGKGFEVEVGVHFSAEERDALSHFAICSVLAQQTTGLSEGAKQDVATELKNRLVRACKGLFDGIFGGDAALVVTARGSYTYPLDVRLELRGDSPPLVIWSYGRITVGRVPGNQWRPVYFPDLLLKEAEARRPGILKESPLPAEAETLIQEIASAATPAWLAGHLEGPPVGPPIVAELQGFDFRNVEAQGVPSEAALLSLRSFLQNRTVEANQLNLFHVLALIYNTAILRTAASPLAPTETPPGSFEPSIPPPALVTDSALAEALFNLKNSPADEERRRFEDIRRVFLDISGCSFDVVLHSRTTQVTRPEFTVVPAEAGPTALGWPTQGTRPSFLAVVEKAEDQIVSDAAIVVTTDGFSVPIEFGAAGLFDLLVVLFAVIGPRDRVILLDEPAMNLHPTKQRRLLQEFLRAVDSGNQAIVVTHSPYLVSTRHLPSVTRLQIHGSSTAVHRFAGKGRLDRVEKWMERDPNLVASLFAEKVVLVEGSDEDAALPEWLMKYHGSNLLEERNAMLFSVGGQESFASYASILAGWNIPFRIVCDKKAKSSLGNLADLAFVLDADDFVDILKECQPAYDQAVKSRAGKQGGKDPAVARLVARESEPPPGLHGLLKGLGEFLTATS